MNYKTKLKHITQSHKIVNLPDDAQGFVLSNIAQNFNENDLIFIAPDEAQMEIIKGQIEFFAPHILENYEILTFNSWDCNPYDGSSPKQIICAQRIKTLFSLSNRQKKNFIVIASLNAVLQKIIAPKLIQNSALIAKAGDKISPSQIIDFLVFNGYQRQSLAYGACEFAVRGGIIDIVIEKASDLIGYRLDFFGDEIESIKEFDPISQLSNQKVRQIELIQASEIVLNKQTIENFRKKYRQIFGSALSLTGENNFYEAISQGRVFQGFEHFMELFYEEELTGIFSYLKNPVILFNDAVNLEAKNYQEKILEAYNARIEDKQKVLKPDSLYFNCDEFFAQIEKNIYINFSNFDDGNKSQRIIDLEFRKIPDFYLAGKANKKDPILLFDEYAKTFKDKKVMVAALNENSKERIQKLFQDHEIKYNISIAIFDKGFEAPDFAMISEQAIFGEKIIRKKSHKNKDAAKRILEEGLSINIGELVVHRDYGIGKFDGIHKIEASGVKTDMIKIIYGGGDTLFVSVEDINLITRYGEDNPLIQLDKLGVASWKNRKGKVKNRIKIAASQLIEMAAKRLTKKAPKFIGNEILYDEFKAKFGFVETDDQASAIDDVEEDLQKGAPMDRLICGDVGFGKTEVAMRAAFIVVSNNSNEIRNQVAIITPTTLLCRQHFKNFMKRFEGTSFKIAQISRLSSVAQNKKTKEGLENGEIDIIIGTHALLAKNLKFKNLSLVIIDEEQHFGVAQKERLKELKNETHLLTLSATPIPRTLQMSLTGVKDLSLIATPPIDRLAVKNFVLSFDSVILKEAIIREYQRSGKVFFVVPRIKYLNEVEDKLKKILPEEIKIKRAHGQMTPAELDEIMNDFYDDKIDVLLSTSIIESGIDVASANTMIIYKAEMFGLAQLYQLRGRVGRGKARGYAYFLTSDKILNKESKKKLEVMQHLDQLGVGFTVASHDMDIRGSGDLLGDEQSGHIKETGVELYQQMLLEEIERQKNKMTNEHEEIIQEECKTQIKLRISLLIDENYIEDLSLRMSFYKKIAALKNAQDKENLENEMFDRFGKIPQETLNLMESAILKHDCQKLGIEKLENSKDGIALTFFNNKFKNPDALLNAVFASAGKIKIMPSHKILLTNNWFDNCENVIKIAKKSVAFISEL